MDTVSSLKFALDSFFTGDGDFLEFFVILMSRGPTFWFLSVILSVLDVKCTGAKVFFLSNESNSFYGAKSVLRFF